MLPVVYVQVDVVTPHCVAYYACAGGCVTTPLRSLVCLCWLGCCHTIVLPGMYVLACLAPPHCVAWYVYGDWFGATPLCTLVFTCLLAWCHPIVLPDMYVLVGVVPPNCVAFMHVFVDVMLPHCDACYLCAGWCGATSLCCLTCMCWLVWCHPFVLPGIYVLVDLLPPHCFLVMHMQVGGVPPHCVGWHACGG